MNNYKPVLSQDEVVALLGRPLSEVEIKNFNIYSEIAVASREQQGAYLCLSRGNAVHLAHWVGECAMQGEAFAAKGLTICQNAGGGAAGLTGARANGMTLSATGGRATAADAKRVGIATREERREREERRSLVGHDGTRTETDDEKRGAFAPKPADIRQNVALFRRNGESCR